ncbi:ATP-dependent RNA helicase [Weissella oryzae SG25]|uniref:ATP-dependent RNA helicase n=1 Tax=Weissella oryzae (strain DSM 25784 / JCM 18191 / LMG 30913 / SG25) TaxID=1329250 RepID=A0A069CSX6_WEIOS|nr:DEAD/DEAH box helicase [Weissella oryzae]GAK30579.1 ATP-dependent RNA helicase [Weissella oryzae SG25]
MDERFETHLTSVGITELTPIQRATATALAEGQSINALAPTGTGKTLAFVWPLLPRLTADDGEQLLVLAPSQELAMQTTRVMREWAALLGLRVLSITGGANVKNQLDRLKKHPEILVGTPGRVAELVASGKLKLQRIKTLILDEADILLQEETANQIDQVWDVIDDADVQVALFGATDLDPSVAAGLFDRDFVQIDQRDVPIPSAIEHEFWLTATDQRAKRLRQLAAQKKFQAMVFFNTTKQLKITASYLAHEHVAMATLVRGDSSSTRQKSLEDFRKGKAKFLLTTDVAARGLDITDLSAVINFDLPRDGETYTHRAGRTGRMGKVGQVISFGNDHDLRDLRRKVAVEINLTGKPGQRNQQNERAEVVTDTTSSVEAPTKPATNSSKVSADTATKPRKIVLGGQNKKKATKRSKPVVEQVSREERFEKEKQAKRKHSKNKGKPKRFSQAD